MLMEASGIVRPSWDDACRYVWPSYGEGIRRQAAVIPLHGQSIRHPMQLAPEQWSTISFEGPDHMASKRSNLTAPERTSASMYLGSNEPNGMRQRTTCSSSWRTNVLGVFLRCRRCQPAKGGQASSVSYQLKSMRPMVPADMELMFLVLRRETASGSIQGRTGGALGEDVQFWLRRIQFSTRSPRTASTQMADRQCGLK